MPEKGVLVDRRKGLFRLRFGLPGEARKARRKLASGLLTVFGRGD